MNGIHDIGGMDGLGRVHPERHQGTFHADWERTVFALVMCLLAEEQFNLDEFRFAIERMDPAEYLDRSYYERWLRAATKLLHEKGVLNGNGSRSEPTKTGRPEQQIRDIVARIESLRAKPSPEPEPRFSSGSPVQVKNRHPETHTRHPRYVRGARGRIEDYLGSWPLADRTALGENPPPEPLYSVRFKIEELWGENAEDPLSVSLDLWESYLQPL